MYFYSQLKNMQKEIKIFTLIILFNTLGCCPSDCDKVPKYFDINGLDLTVKKITKIYGDSSFTSEIFDTNNSIDLELLPKVNYYGLNNSFNFGNLFINSAYACKCGGPGHQGSMENISDIIIFSNNQFLSSSSISDTLTQYFNISGLGSKFSIKPTDLVTFLTTQPPAMNKIELTLKIIPSGSNEHKFTIIYKQTNGETYEVMTPNIQFI
jgi:hypothetical protein